MSLNEGVVQVLFPMIFWVGALWSLTDNDGAATTSAPVTIAVNSAVKQIYYIHPDHLNSPRRIYDQSQQLVWAWEQGEPFGNDVPNGNPSGLGAVDFPLRFPGQYFDRETGLAYNMARDYSPEIGRYIESDPIGLRGDLNTYAYVGGNPVSFTDPRGLIAWPVGVPFPRPAPPPGPGGSPGGQPGGSGLPPELDPSQPRPPTFPEIRVPPFPPSSPPPQPKSICEHLFNVCMQGANACPAPIQSAGKGFCLAAYLICVSIGGPGGGGDPNPSP